MIFIPTDNVYNRIGNTFFTTIEEAKACEHKCVCVSNVEAIDRTLRFYKKMGNAIIACDVKKV